MDYTTNFINSMNGYLGYPTGEEPVEGGFIKKTTSLDDTADLRDSISYLAAQKNIDFKNQDIKAQFGKLTRLLGRPSAQKVIDQLAVFNQRSDVANLSPQERINSFFTIGSNNKELKPIIERVKTFGSGINSGFTDSVDIGNMKITKSVDESVPSNAIGQSDKISLKMKNKF